MILDTLDLDAAAFARRTGWEIKPEGACRDGRCVPLPAMPAVPAGHVDVRVFAERLGMPLLHDEAHGLWSLGPESGGRVLASAALPDIELPDLDGIPFALRSLRGQKVLLLAWASW